MIPLGWKENDLTEVTVACTGLQKDMHIAQIEGLRRYPIATTTTKNTSSRNVQPLDSSHTSILLLFVIWPVYHSQPNTPSPPQASTRISIQKTPASRSKNHSLAINNAKTNNAFERSKRGMSLFGILTLPIKSVAQVTVAGRRKRWVDC